MQEVEGYRLGIVGLTSTHSLGSGTQFFERGRILHLFDVDHGERRRASVGLLIAPQFSRHLLNKRVTSLCLRAGNRSLTVILTYGPNSHAEHPTFLKSLGGVLDGGPTACWGCSTGRLQHPCVQQQ